MGRRAGDTTSFVSAYFTSGVDSLTLGASSSVGESGHRVGLESAYSGSGDNTSVLGSIHAITAASIMQLTDRRTDRLSVAPLVLGGLVVGRVAIPHVVRWSRTIVNAYLLAEQVKEQAEEAAKKVADESSSAATGGPKGQLPDGEDPEEERKTNCSKSESPVWKAAQPFKGQYKRNAKGDEIYKWDYTHNEIEVFNSRGQHVGVKDPLTGLKIKDAVPGRVEIGIK